MQTTYSTPTVGAALLDAAIALDQASESLRAAAAAPDLPGMATTDRVAFLSVIGAAAMLGVSRATIHRRIADGTLRSRRIGGRRLIPLAAIEEMSRAAGA